MPSPSSRTALITGASRGLGLALARALAGRGWSLIVDARGAAALRAVSTELSKVTQVTAVPGDVSDDAHRRALAVAARAAGGLDALVNNASILGPSPQPSLLDYPLDVLEQVYRVNVVALRELTDDSGGRTEIVRSARDLDPATASVADELSKQYYLGYPATGKADGRWHRIRVELRNPNYRVRARRGYVATP